MKYLLDTNIVIFFFKGKFEIEEKMDAVGITNCLISEITLAELKFGAENSGNVEKHRSEVDELIETVQVLPITSALDIFAKEKARLRKQGLPLDDFDLLIAATAIANGITLVTNNVKHFSRIEGLTIEDWAIRKPA